MISKFLLGTFCTLTLAACQNQTASEKHDTTTLDLRNSTPATPTQPKSGESRTPVSLSPDTGAAEISSHEMENTAKNTEGVVYLKEGENKLLKDYEMNVTFKRMVEDSRCPQGVNCVWEGVAVAEVELMGLYTRPVTVRLSTMNNVKKGYAKSQDFNGYAVSLVEVTPQPTSDNSAKSLEGSYRIGLKIAKSSSGNSTNQSTTTK